MNALHSLAEPFKHCYVKPRPGRKTLEQQAAQAPYAYLHLPGMKPRADVVDVLSNQNRKRLYDIGFDTLFPYGSETPTMV